LYEAALFETDSNKLLQRITAARTAILDRIEESVTRPVPAECRAMDDALRTLRRLESRYHRGVSTMQDYALLVDDEPYILLTLGLVLKLEGFNVQTAESAQAAKTFLCQTKFDLVVTDLSLEQPLSGFEIIRLANLQPIKPATVVISGFEDLLATWKENGANAGLTKPADIEELLATIDHLLPHRKSVKSGGEARPRGTHKNKQVDEKG